MPGISELFRRRKAQEQAEAERRRMAAKRAEQESVESEQAATVARQRREEVNRRAAPLQRQIASSPIPELLDQAEQILPERSPYGSGRTSGSGEESGRIYASEGVHHSNGGVNFEVEVRQFEDGDVEVIGKKRIRLRGRDAQDKSKLDKAIGEATENPKVTIDEYQDHSGWM